MDIKAFFQTALSKVTTWVAAGLLLITQIQPVFEWLQGVIGTLSPAKAALLGIIGTWIGRIHGILEDAKAKLPKDPPAV